MDAEEAAAVLHRPSRVVPDQPVEVDAGWRIRCLLDGRIVKLFGQASALRSNVFRSNAFGGSRLLRRCVACKVGCWAQDVYALHLLAEMRAEVTHISRQQVCGTCCHGRQPDGTILVRK